MVKVLSVVIMLALAGCSSMPMGSSSSYSGSGSSASGCTSATTYACQVEMYSKAGA